MKERENKPVAVGELVKRGKRRITDLGDAHLLEALSGKVLEASDVDGAFLGLVEVAASNAEIARGADHTARKTKRVVRKDHLGSSIVVLRQEKDKDV